MNSGAQFAFRNMLREVYSAEAQLAVKLASISGAGISGELRRVLLHMREQSMGELVHLESMMAMLDESSPGEPWFAVSFLLIDVQDAAEAQQGVAREVGVAVSLAGIKHLEIARYQALQVWSQQQGLEAMSRQLRASLTGAVDMSRLLTSHAHRMARDSADELELLHTTH